MQTLLLHGSCEFSLRIVNDLWCSWCVKAYSRSWEVERETCEEIDSLRACSCDLDRSASLSVRNRALICYYVYSVQSRIPRYTASRECLSVLWDLVPEVSFENVALCLYAVYEREWPQR